MVLNEQKENNNKYSQYIKNKLFEIIGFVISVIALFFAYSANNTSKKAIDLSVRTYLSVSPTRIPINSEPLLSTSSFFNIKDDVEKFVAVFGMDNKLTVILWLSVENLGSIEANDVILQMNLDFINEFDSETSLLSVIQKFEIGDIAPGKGADHDVYITIDDQLKEFPAEQIQNWFEHDHVKIRLIITTTYKNYNGKTIQSGSFSGITKNAGASITKTTIVEKFTN